MTTPIEDIRDLKTRLNRLQNTYRRRNQMINYCDELYMMIRERKSGFLPGPATAWRSKVAAEYWESSNRPQNVVDIMTAVLSGHVPQYQCTIPGNASSTTPSRAEMFLDGVWRLNSRRQQQDLVQQVVFKTVKDGGVGIRVYWRPDSDKASAFVMPSPDGPEELPWVVQTFGPYNFPIVVEVIDLKKLYFTGSAAYGRPFSEVFYTQMRTPADVLYEWEGRDGANVANVDKGLKVGDRQVQEYEYVEWWGQDVSGQVHYAIAYRDDFIIAPTPIDYPTIPFVVTTYKHGLTDDPSMARLPFLYPIFPAIEKMEYLKSRSFRLIDLFANLNPYHSGDQPIENFEATWGKIIELGPKEEIKFPIWPGQPPDVHRELAEIETEIAEGSFSGAMFGQVSSRLSGFALSQLIGSDTLRTDVPRANLELAFSAVADIIFGLMQTFSPTIKLATTSQVKNQRIAAMLSGDETPQLIVETFVKPKQTSDEVRLASMGAQLASLPNPPVSMKYILERFFGINQPEEEMNRKLDEDAMKEPIVRMMAMMQVLEENNSPFAAVIAQQLQQAVQVQMMQQQALQQQQQQLTGPPQPGGLGLGLPQALNGNPPIVPGSGQVGEETEPTLQDNIDGGPVPQGLL